MNFRVCYVCKIEKDINDFYIRDKKKNTYHYECKKCRCDKNKEITLKNKCNKEYKNKRKVHNEKYIKKYGYRKHVGTISHIQRLYGLSEQDYYDLLEKQNNKCGICGIEEKEFLKTTKIKRKLTKFFIDHDHETNMVRGLLCDKCNRGIGLLGDTYKSVEKALKYLKE